MRRSIRRRTSSRFHYALIQTLETRRLLASVGISAGVLTVTGNESSDTINIAPDASGQAVVTINGSSQNFALANFTGIVVNALGGGDNVTLAGSLTKPATLNGGAGNDSLVGGGGNDLLDGGLGADMLRGGAGNDTVTYASRTNAVHIGLGTLNDDGEAAEHDNVWNDIENAIGGSGNDTFTGTNARNFFQGNGGNDHVDARGGNDSVLGGAGNDTLLGGLEDDTLNGNAGNDSIEGNGGNDSLLGEAGNDSMTGESGNDTLHGGSGDDVLSGGDGTDTGSSAAVYSSIENYINDLTATVVGGVLMITGSDDPEFVSIEPWVNNQWVVKLGAEVKVFAASDFNAIEIDTKGGNDTVDLSKVNVPSLPSTILGGAGNDSLVGGAGSDFIDGGAGGDTMKGGGGNDTVTYSSRTGNVTVGLGTASDDGEANEKDNVATDVETVLGGAGNDTLSALNAGMKANLLVGNGGDDSLIGGGGDDTLSGNAGADTLNGGDGFDTAINAAGDQTFNIESGGEGAGTAVITPNRTLLITGTDSGDTVGMTSFSSSDGSEGELVTINGSEHTFDFDDFDRIQIDLRGSGDYIQLHFTQFDNVTINGGDGNDTFDLATANAEVVNGGAGDDYLSALEGFTHFVGGAGNDTYDSNNLDADLDLRLMPDVENGYVFNGTLHGNELPNVLQTGEFAEIFGHGGNDTIIVGGVVGGDNDVLSILYGDSGDDTIIGGASGDSIFGGDGADSIDGGGGDDTIKGEAANDTINGGAGIDHVEGNAGNDVIHGNDANDRLFGGSGMDQLFGDGGDDFLQGQADADSLDGGAGAADKGDADGVDTLTNVELVV